MIGSEDLQTVAYERDGHVALVRLDRPDRLNAIDAQMQFELERVWRDFDADPELRVALLTGTGDRAFCSGADVGGGDRPLGRAVGHSTGAAALGRYTPLRIPTWKPIVLAVNGMCAGSGLHFVHDADVIVASEGATFFDTHLALGLVAAGEPIGLSRRMPIGEVMAMMLLGKEYRLTATRAHAIGMVHEVVASEQLSARSLELARIIARQAPEATQLTKKAIYTGLDHGLATANEIGAFLLQSHARSEEAAEGLAAFRERRAPRWNSATDSEGDRT